MPRKREIVLGISFGHGDSSAALLIGGKLVAAAEEERFTRVKHFGLFPHLAIQYCLKHAGLSPRQIPVVALPKKRWSQFAAKTALALKHPALLKKSAPAKADPSVSLAFELRKAGLGRARLVRVEHHLAHLMSARYLTQHENPALLSFDGLGDFVSVAMGRPKEASAEILQRVLFPHSVGFFYTAMTQYLGFPHYGDEFKVMGLSSYGKPRYLDAMRDLIRDDGEWGFRLNLEAFPLLRRPMAFYLENAQPKVSPFFLNNYITQGLGFGPRKPGEKLQTKHEDLAMSIQARFEEVANRLLTHLHKLVPSKTLCLAGGCAHNSVWVGKIPRVSGFENILVAPASHDAGLAVGAAIEASGVRATAENENWMLLGPSHAAEPTLELPTDLNSKTFSDEGKLANYLAEQLADGKIVGLFHGRMEFGPRALGSRSILCDPRGPHMKEKLNARVKHREAFRPFAASVLYEDQEQWFHNTFFAPTMEAVFEVKDSVRKKIPAVVHHDGSCRIQSVTKEMQPFYYRLIEAFKKRTGVPMLLNTSFNDSEPIVCTEADALHCFQNCEMDVLVMGNQVVERKAQSAALSA